MRGTRRGSQACLRGGSELYVPCRFGKRVPAGKLGLAWCEVDAAERRELSSAAGSSRVKHRREHSAAPYAARALIPQGATPAAGTRRTPLYIRRDTPPPKATSNKILTSVIPTHCSELVLQVAPGTSTPAHTLLSVPISEACGDTRPPAQPPC